MATSNELLRATPEAQGITSQAIVDFIDGIEQNQLELHGMMLMRHGAVVAEGWWAPYGPRLKHMLFSLSKSFTSTAVGFAVTEGRLTVDDRVVSFFPEDCPATIGPNLAAMKVRHLLSMSTGHQEDSTGRVGSRKDGNWVKAFLSLEVEHEPGSLFVYNSGASYMLSAIVQKVTGQKLIDYLKPRLFDPLGIRGATWETCPRGINTGGWGLNIKTEDIARFGQLYLQKGVWNGQRVLPEAWVEEATRKHISNGDDPNSDWAQGYGYQFWRCRHNLYRGDGAFGQYCIVMPEQDAVLAINSGVGDMQAVMNQAWDHLLPAMGKAPLPEDPAGLAKLRERLACLAIRPPQGADSSPRAAQVSGKTFVFAPNPLKIKTACFNLDGGACELTVLAGRKAHILRAALGPQWELGKTTLFRRGPMKVAAAAVWSAPDTLLIAAQGYETPFRHTITAQFEGDSVTLSLATNVSFGPTEMPPVVGKMQ